MQRGRGGRDPFDDPFFSSSFGDPFAGFGSFGGRRSIMSNFFGGRDPFDDPFFARPFGGLSNPMGSSFFGGNMFPPSGFVENQAFPSSDQQAPETKRLRGPIIEEIVSDEEHEESREEKRGNRRQHAGSSIEAHIEDPDDEEERNAHLQVRDDFNRLNDMQRNQPRSHGYTFQSSTVTYGGTNGPYYTSSRTKRTGSDGVTFEESKEADASTRQATHKIHRGLHDKGHSITRKLGSDGEVDTMQMLHNLNEDELAGFEESWKGKAPHLHGLNDDLIGDGSGSTTLNEPMWVARTLPSTELPQSSKRVKPSARNREGIPPVQHSGKKKVDVKGRGKH